MAGAARCQQERVGGPAWRWQEGCRTWGPARGSDRRLRHVNSSVHINRVRVQILSERHKYGTKSGNWIKIDGLDTNF